VDSPAPRFAKAAPILYVRDLDAEVDFYLALGFEIVYRGEAFPGFVALGGHGFEFALERRDAFDPAAVPRVLVWQLEAHSLRSVLALAADHGWEVDGPRCYWPEQDAWEMSVRTPNGWALAVEGPNPALR